MEFIDTHTHLYLELFSDDYDSAVKLAVDAGVKHMLLPNVDIDTVESMMGLANQFPDNCHPMMAIHPTSIKEDYKEKLEEIKHLLFNGNFIAVGETGIDLYWDKTFYNEQVFSFEQHIEWAIKLDLPIVIHSRKSLDEIVKVLDNYKSSNIKGVFHCFPGNLIQAKKVIERGFYLGIGGVVTYKNSDMSKVVSEIPLEWLLLETDAPYLPPVPHRGKRNESAYIPIIAEKVAELKGVSLEEVARITTDNAKKVFNL
ncbi:MAG: TatD family hydrolase [Bacteroidetes bacterium]|nr:TatD family hydrolase [Bacteroidota bacterium]